jgi:hypothetical protein
MLTQNGFSYRNLAANATTVIRTGPGILHSITINDQGASSNTCAVYDNTAGTGTLIATIDTVTATGNLLYDVQFNTGLTIVIATGTAANITVSWMPLASVQS